VGDALVAQAAGAEDVQLQLDRGEVPARRDRAEGGPGGDRVAERRPDAAVDEAAGMQVTRLDLDAPTRVVVLDLEGLDAEVGREAADRELVDVLRLDLREIGHVSDMKKEGAPSAGRL